MTQQAGVRLTEAAANRIAAILKDQKRPYLRVAVNGGGCSGFSYAFDLADEKEPEDLAVGTAGQVLIDEASLPFLEGCEIDFVDELIGASFRINNPNAKSSCGCGTSFSI